MDVKEHECKRKKIQDGKLFKEKKKVQRKMDAPGICFFWLEVGLDSPCQQLGWEAPVIPIENEHIVYASMPPFNAGGFGKDGGSAKEAQNGEV